MKSIFYFIAILLVTVSLSSCSKKNNGDTQQQPQSGQEQSAADGNDRNGQEQSSETQVNEQTANIQIVPVPNQDVIVLNAEETIQILRAAGFSDSQIQKYGSSVREALAKSGAVRIMIDKVVKTGLAVRGDDIYISTRSRGYFIYNIKTGWVNKQKQ